jgi:hypothetical protein
MINKPRKNCIFARTIKVSQGSKSTHAKLLYSMRLIKLWCIRNTTLDNGFFDKACLFASLFTLPNKKYSFSPGTGHFISTMKTNRGKIVFLLVKVSQGSKSTQNFCILWDQGVYKNGRWSASEAAETCVMHFSVLSVHKKEFSKKTKNFKFSTGFIKTIVTWQFLTRCPRYLFLVLHRSLATAVVPKKCFCNVNHRNISTSKL